MDWDGGGRCFEGRWIGRRGLVGDLLQIAVGQSKGRGDMKQEAQDHRELESASGARALRVGRPTDGGERDAEGDEAERPIVERAGIAPSAGGHDQARRRGGEHQQRSVRWPTLFVKLNSAAGLDSSDDAAVTGHGE
jgi:hypothetical protein